MIAPANPVDDPFFKEIFDGQWNATVGRQGHEENYLDGYIEAALVMVDSLVANKLFGQRDTLVLPILYNARHGLELNLKFATQTLAGAGAIKDDNRGLSHDIAAYWIHLNASNVGDAKLRIIIQALKPFVDSLAQVDNDGQELRYYRSREGQLSLQKFAIVNLKLVQRSLRELQRLLSDLKYRTLTFKDELGTGSFTAFCSRSDLMEIAKALPPHRDWSESFFDDRKAEIKARFMFGSKHFTEALNKIPTNREMKAIIGVETPLLHLTDDDVRWVVEQWRTIHPERKHGESEIGLNYFDAARFEDMHQSQKLYSDAIDAIDQRLSPEKLADLEVLFYLERDRHYSERYETMVTSKLREHAAAGDREEEIRHLMEKTNFLHCVRGSAFKLGRIDLARHLDAA